MTQVPHDRTLRHEVSALTGPHETPVLIDGDVVPWDSRRIVAYPYETCGSPRQLERAPEIREELAPGAAHQ